MRGEKGREEWKDKKNNNNKQTTTKRRRRIRVDAKVNHRFRGGGHLTI